MRMLSADGLYVSSVQRAPHQSWVASPQSHTFLDLSSNLKKLLRKPAHFPQSPKLSFLCNLTTCFVFRMGELSAALVRPPGEMCRNLFGTTVRCLKQSTDAFGNFLYRDHPCRPPIYVRGVVSLVGKLASERASPLLNVASFSWNLGRSQDEDEAWLLDG